MDLGQLYQKAGVKSVGTVLLLTDAQIADERFLVLINDLLASGEIPDLFPDDEVENIILSMRNEVKGLGLFDSRENCWRFFIDRVRKQLKVSECSGWSCDSQSSSEGECTQTAEGMCTQAAEGKCMQAAEA